jgi:uncharacterized protein involved in exopolysaccharide biosynthesis
MINKDKRNEDFDSSGLIVFLYKWRKPLFIILVASIVLSWFFSGPWFIPPKYKATVILFPTSSNSTAKTLFSEQGGKGTDLMAFGEDEQAEQLLQILSSNKIRDKIIRKFDLMQHYDIDTNSKYKNSLLFREYERNISFRRTEFMAVQISAYDKDPQMAADIANKIAELIDSTKNEMQRQRALKGFQIVEAEYKNLQKDVKATVDSLVKLGDLGVNDVEYQSQAYNQQMAIAIMNGNKSAQSDLQKKLDILGKYGGVYMSLKNALEFKTEQLTILQAKYKEAKVDAEENLPQKFIVNDAYKAEKKSYPVRWLIILVSTFSTFFLAVIILIIMEKISAYNAHKTFNLG